MSLQDVLEVCPYRMYLKYVGTGCTWSMSLQDVLEVCRYRMYLKYVGTNISFIHDQIKALNKDSVKFLSVFCSMNLIWLYERENAGSSAILVASKHSQETNFLQVITKPWSPLILQTSSLLRVVLRVGSVRWTSVNVWCANK